MNTSIFVTCWIAFLLSLGHLLAQPTRNQPNWRAQRNRFAQHNRLDQPNPLAQPNRFYQPNPLDQPNPLAQPNPLDQPTTKPEDFIPSNSNMTVENPVNQCALSNCGNEHRFPPS